MPLVQTLALAAIRNAGSALATKLDPGERIARQFSESALEADRELGQVAYAVATALLADALGMNPQGAQVQALLTALADSPGAPARVYRLLGEARKSPSTKRRQMLAAVLYGLPLTNIADADRDRIDMLVERLLPEDIALLGAICRCEAAPPRHAPHGEPYCCAVQYSGLRLMPAADLERSGVTRSTIEAVPNISTPAFTALQSNGCIYLPNGLLEETVVEGITVMMGRITITPLGRLLLSALQDVRAGFSVDTRSEDQRST